MAMNLQTCKTRTLLRLVLSTQEDKNACIIFLRTLVADISKLKKVIVLHWR